MPIFVPCSQTKNVLCVGRVSATSDLLTVADERDCWHRHVHAICQFCYCQWTETLCIWDGLHAACDTVWTGTATSEETAAWTTWHAWSLKMEPIAWTETSVASNHPTRRNILKKERSAGFILISSFVKLKPAGFSKTPVLLYQTNRLTILLFILSPRLSLQRGGKVRD